MAQEEDEAAACSLDVTSEEFDPLLALYSPTTPLPFPDVRCFNNLAEYESFLRGRGRARGRPPGAPKAEKKGRKPAPDPERVERLKSLMVQTEGETEPKGPPRRGRRPPKNVLTRMPLHEGSPVGRLYRCIQERLKVNVHIRTFKGLRGVCSGFIVAFDKCWNMAMVDVDETYRKPVLGKAFYNEPQLTLTRLFDRLKLQESGDRSSTEASSAASQTLEPPARTGTQRGEGEDMTRTTSRERRRASQQSSAASQTLEPPLPPPQPPPPQPPPLPPSPPHTGPQRGEGKDMTRTTSRERRRASQQSSAASQRLEPPPPPPPQQPPPLPPSPPHTGAQQGEGKDKTRTTSRDPRRASQQSRSASQRLEPPPPPPPPHTGAQRGEGKDKTRTTSRERRRASSQQSGQDSSDQDQRQKAVKPKQRSRRRKEKIDYQQVFTRHLKQVFIRGESVLLVHVPE